MAELGNLIKRLEKHVAKQSSYIKSIRNPAMLIRSLIDLKNIIGNEKVKNNIAEQVNYLIHSKYRKRLHPEIKEDDSMLNTALYGPPGVGKTLIGSKIAKIYYSLGYIDGSKKSSPSTVSKLFNKEQTSNPANESQMLNFLIFFMFVMLILISLSSLIWKNLGGVYVAVLLGIVFFIFVVFIIYYNSNSVNNNTNVSKNNIDNNVQIQPKTKIAEPSDDKLFKIVSRPDFIGQYVGWTAAKTNALLEDNLGKVLFVDEAYSLVNGPRDDFGIEALTALNLFLSQRKGEIIVIFAGYEELMESQIYSYQKGLKRRFMWHFTCEGYSPSELFEIFKLKLTVEGMKVRNEEEVVDLFVKNKTAFANYGGDCERLLNYSKLKHATYCMSKSVAKGENKDFYNTLETEHIKQGVDVLIENSVKDSVSSKDDMMNLLRNGGNSNMRDTLGRMFN